MASNPKVSNPLAWLRSIIRHGKKPIDIDALIEEHKSATEELQSMNEELQSSNEELETAKEEMQAANEELQSVNTELSEKNIALERISSDMRNLLDSTQVATLFLTKNSIIRTFTPAMKEIFHLREGDCGRPIGEIVSQLNYSSIEADVETTLRTLAVTERHVQLKTDPTTIFLVRVRPYRTVADQIDGCVITFVNVSAISKAQSEKFLAETNFLLAKDAIGIGAWILDLNTGMISGSDRMQRLIGYSPTDGPLNLDWFRARMGPAEVAKLELDYRSPIIGGEEHQSEIRLKRDEDSICLLIRGRAFVDSATNVREIRGILIDITEQVNLKAALEQRLRLEALGRLTGGVAHDFNNLLTIILGNLNLMAPELNTARSKQYADEALQAAKLSALINQKLLSFGGLQTLKPIAIEINDKIASCLPLLQRTASSAIEIVTHLAAANSRVNVDPTEFDSALINLVGNARDAMPNGGEIRIETEDVTVDQATAQREQTADGAYCRVSVKDNGGGMSPQVLSKAVEPFFTTKAKAGGTGLGLASVHGFVKQSLGFMNIQSSVDAGTTIELYFPVHSGENATVSAGMTNDKIIQSLRVLVVEDNLSLSRLAVEFFHVLGHECVTAFNAKEAIACLESRRDIDVLFSDVILPGGQNGYEIAGIVKHRWPNVKILMTSGFLGKFDVAPRLGTDDLPLLNKPYSLEQLAAAISRL